MGKRLFPVLIVVAVLFFVLYKGLVPETQIPATAPPTSTTSTSSKSSISQPESQRPLAIDEKTQANKVADYCNNTLAYLIFISAKKRLELKVGMRKRAIYVTFYQDGRLVVIAL